VMDYRRKLDRLLAEHSLACSQIAAEKAALRKAEESKTYSEEAQALVQAVAEEVQNHCHARIASVVTKCLGSVFYNPYLFHIDFQRKRGRTEAELYLERGGKEFRDPLNECGGGVCDLVSFALRLVALVLSMPKLRRSLLLDEPFRHLKPAEQYGPLVCELMERLAGDFGCQFISVQNLESFITGKVVKL
jgi:hypothetical protein